MKLTENIHQLQIDFEIVLSPEKKLSRFVNVILIFGKKISLIDTGVKGSETRIFDYIRQQHRHPSEIERIILSHSHPDHIGSAAVIKEQTGCRVLAHPAEKTWIENIEIQMKERPVPGFFNLVDRSVKIDSFISDGQEFIFDDGISARIIHSPGHSRGSLNVFFKEDKILFTADSIPLKNDIPNYDDYKDLLHSLDTIKNKWQFSMLLTSWTPAMTDPGGIANLIAEGENYIRRIDGAVREYYGHNGVDDPCKSTIEKLGLPPFLANPITDKAFRSHMI